MAGITLRRIAIFGAPVALGALAAIHPMMPDDNLAIWNLIHILQIPLAALFGIGLLLMLRGIVGGAANAARMAIIPWIAFFAAYDGVAGLATGSLAGYGHAHPEAAEAVASAAAAMVDSPYLGLVLMIGAVGFALIVFGGTAVALRRSGASPYAAIAIAIGGVVWTFVHPLIGAPAMLVFLIGAAAVELAAARDTAVSPATAVAGA
jgi:hypothetical protein